MGRKFNEVQQEMKMVPFKVVEGPNGDALVEITGKRYTPPEISAMILQEPRKPRKPTWAKRLKKRS